MKTSTERFINAFRSLKNHGDLIPMTSYQREEFLINLNEMRNEYERIVDALKKLQAK